MPSLFLKLFFAHVDRLYRQHPTDPALCECRFTQRLTSCDAGAADGLLAKLLIQNPRSPSPHRSPTLTSPPLPPTSCGCAPACCRHPFMCVTLQLFAPDNQNVFKSSHGKKKYYFKRTNALTLRFSFPLPLHVRSFDWHLYQGHSAPTLSWIRTCAFNAIHCKEE